jgi:hypothetical protein
LSLARIENSQDLKAGADPAARNQRSLFGVSIYKEAMNARTIALLVAGGTFSSLHGEKPQRSLQWVDLSATYSRFEDIKPKLINKGKVSVFLSRLYPDGSARLQRFNSETGRWEPGEWSITCGVVSQATVPIEIKPNSEREIQVYWQLSTDR